MTKYLRTILVLLLLMATAMPIALAHNDDGGADEPWINDMNQASYWQTRFGAGWTCTKFEDHGGGIPAGYEAVIVHDGQWVRVYMNPSGAAFTALGPHNPNSPTGAHFAPPHSWVMKCNFTQTTTTTVPEEDTTTTTVDDTTTTVDDTTTTTVDDTTTTTVEDTTTTTGQDTTTTTQATTTTSVPEETTTTPPENTSSSIVTTTTMASTTTTDPTGSTLPFTGVDNGLLVGLGASALALGALLLFAVRREET